MSPAILGELIPIVAIVFGMSVGAISILAAHRQRLQRAELRHRERLAQIDKGLEVPPDPAELERRQRGNPLQRGLVWLFVGLAATAALYQVDSRDVPYLWGLVPAAVGFGNLVYYAIEGRHAARLGADRGPPDATPGL